VVSLSYPGFHGHLRTNFVTTMNGGEKKEGQGEERGSVTVFQGMFSRTATRSEGGGETKVLGRVRLPLGRTERGLTIHAGADVGEFMIEERRFDPVGPIGRKLHRQRVEEGRMKEARPRPLVRPWG